MVHRKPVDLAHSLTLASGVFPENTALSRSSTLHVRARRAISADAVLREEAKVSCTSAESSRAPSAEKTTSDPSTFTLLNRCVNVAIAFDIRLPVNIQKPIRATIGHVIAPSSAISEEPNL